MKKPLDRLG